MVADTLAASIPARMRNSALGVDGLRRAFYAGFPPVIVYSYRFKAFEDCLSQIITPNGHNTDLTKGCFAIPAGSISTEFKKLGYPGPAGM